MRNRLPLILSALALVVSLTGAGAIAASSMIDGATIKNGSIGAAKLTKNAQAFLKGKRGERGFRGYDGQDGADGFDGGAGAPGAPGAPGPAGGFNPAKVIYVTGPTISLPPYPTDGYTQSALATCPAGYKAIAGGFFASINNVGATLNTPDGQSWGVILQNLSPVSTTGNAYAVCATA